MEKAINERQPLNMVIRICHAAVKDSCEDSFAYGVCDSCGMLGVFDGCGGLGARRYERQDNRTGAYIASRVAAKTVMEWFDGRRVFGDFKVAEDVSDELKQRLDGELGEKSRQLDHGNHRTGGTMIRPFPTTAAIALHDWSAKERLLCQCVWAGDSRVYILKPDRLRQCTADDLRINNDAFENLYNDSPLSNLIAADGEYRLNSVRVACGYPAIIIAATDGTFGYLPSPMHYEWLMLDALMNSRSPEEFEFELGGRIGEIAEDDATLVMAAFGWNSFADMRAAFTQRHAHLRQRLEEARDDAALREFWDEYKQGYYVRGK